jgi:tRNA modification GTPase
VTPDTVVSCLTPPGQAALATVVLHGPGAWEAARALFRPARGELPEQPEPGRFWFGRLGAELADEVVLAVKGAAPPWLEAHCHGGRAVVQALLDQLTARGLRLCAWPEVVRRTEDDPLRAAAAVALAQAPTARTAAVLLDQHSGALGAALDAIMAQLHKPEAPARDEPAPLAGASGLWALAKWAPLGRHLTAPWRVVVAGAPNVGKSSLVNALAGYQRSIVAPTPGTTRDVVTAALAFDGWPVELADTAGLRGEAGSLEEEGIRRARAAAAAADLVLWLLDASAAPVWPDEGLKNVRLVVNKVDLAPAWALEQAGDAVRVSARTGEGVAGLSEALGRWLVPEAPPPGSAVPFTPALANGAVEALQHARAGRPDEALAVVRRLRGA